MKSFASMHAVAARGINSAIRHRRLFVLPFRSRDSCERGGGKCGDSVEGSFGSLSGVC